MKKLIFIFTLILSIITFAEEKIKVVSFNIAAGAKNFKADLNKTADAIKALDADIIGIQEVDRLTKRSGYVDQIKVLADLTGYNFVFGKTIDFDGGEYGIGILTKHPILKAEKIVLPNEPNEEPRVALMAQVKVPTIQEPVNFINTHLGIVLNAKTDEELARDSSIRVRQAKVINDYAAKIKGLKFLVGDMNDGINSDSMTLLKYNWKCVFDEETPNTYTYSATEPFKGIDFIFVSPEKQWNINAFVPSTEEYRNETGIDWRIISDHLPVIATFEAK
ncbi:endonuclease/exonuclease/phosphatase family protein [Fusobacterium sp. HC1336]|jgi:endonuclease/exonuclease/phosphatase family metal-dependent hydrolase|uniref:endonuclease/exonuclease/phosphatase family protein n=1 Tax=Fusobacterium sp. HC1336 TaxID=3171169 RepID=UPI003F28D3D2